MYVIIPDYFSTFDTRFHIIWVVSVIKYRSVLRPEFNCDFYTFLHRESDHLILGCCQGGIGGGRWGLRCISNVYTPIMMIPCRWNIY